MGQNDGLQSGAPPTPAVPPPPATPPDPPLPHLPQPRLVTSSTQMLSQLLVQQYESFGHTHCHTLGSPHPGPC